MSTNNNERRIAFESGLTRGLDIMAVLCALLAVVYLLYSPAEDYGIWLVFAPLGFAVLTMFTVAKWVQSSAN